MYHHRIGLLHQNFRQFLSFMDSLWHIKGIVSRDWERLQWFPSVRSEECRVTGAYFYSILMPFWCFNSKKACFCGFSFDSYSANDEWQPQIIFFHRQVAESCMMRAESSPAVNLSSSGKFSCGDLQNNLMKYEIYFEFFEIGYKMKIWPR